MEIHFTVRLAMANGRNKCSTLKKWRTALQDDGTVYWRLRERTVHEDKLAENDTNGEYGILRGWCDGEFGGVPTDRSAFATELRGLIQDPSAVSSGNLNSFVWFLKSDMNFEESQLAPTAMYPPQRGG
jgi:hypothetical protein